LIDVKSIRRNPEDDSTFLFEDDGEEKVYEEVFSAEDWDSPEAFKFAGIRGYEPMTAKELDTEEKQDECFARKDYVVEEKFDGTRALVYFFATQEYENEEPVRDVGYCRVFSRRVSKKTGFYVENTDSLPQIREINVPSLGGTILDGEMFINDLPFKEVSSTLNCLWDKAIDRQIEKGFISFHAFDILFYRGIDLRNFTLEKRKEYLDIVIKEAGSLFIEPVDCFTCGDTMTSVNGEVDLYSEVMKRVPEVYEDEYFEGLEEDKDTYPHLYECWKRDLPLTPRAYYELIVSTGGEGVMVKPLSGKYLHKRGWEYSKVKKFLTRELVITGFDEPTREYSGKDIRHWGYWENEKTHKLLSGVHYGERDCVAVTKFYYQRQVGNLLLAVVITQDEYESIPEKKRGEITEFSDGKYLMHVCECSGFDDDTRSYFTRNRNKLINSVVEVKCNEIFRDSGKMRHPRFMRMRPDKNAEQCVWIDHVGVSEVTK